MSDMIRRLFPLAGAVALGVALAACGVPVPNGCGQRTIGTADEMPSRHPDWRCIDFGFPPGEIGGGASWHEPGGVPTGPVQALSVDCTGPGHVYGLYVDGAPENPSAEVCVRREYDGTAGR